MVRGKSLAFALAISLVLAGFGAAFAKGWRAGDGESSGWEKVEFVVAAGPAMEPYSSTIKNRYFGYDSGGNLVATESGAGVFTPWVLTLRDSFALSFRDHVAVAGRKIEEFPTSVEYVDRFASMPNLEAGAFFYNTATDGYFRYRSDIYTADGDRVQVDIPYRLDFTRGEDVGIVALSRLSDEWSKAPDVDFEGWLFTLIRKDGSVLELPANGVIGTDHELNDGPFLEYKGNGLFAVYQVYWEREGGRALGTSFFRLDGEQLHPVEGGQSRSIPEGFYTEDLEKVAILKGGDLAKINTSGVVQIFDSRSGELSEVGTVPEIDGLLGSRNVVRAFNPVEGAFAIVQDGRVRVFDWRDPTSALFDVQVPVERCGDTAVERWYVGEGCGITSVSFRR